MSLRGQVQFFMRAQCSLRDNLPNKKKVGLYLNLKCQKHLHKKCTAKYFLVGHFFGF